MGGTPYQFFVPSGEHELTFTKGGLPVASTTLHVDHPLFLTSLIHRTDKLEADISALTEQQVRAINRFNIQEVIDTSAITEFDDIHPYPPVFKTLVQDAVAMGMDGQTVQNSFALAANFITSPAMLADALEAKEGLHSPSKLVEATLEAAKRLFDDATTAEVGLLGTEHPLQGKQTTLRQRGLNRRE